MSQPSDLDQSLARVHQQCADLCVVLASISNLQMRARKLLPLLLGELKELQLRLQPAIDRLSEDLEEGSR